MVSEIIRSAGTLGLMYLNRWLVNLSSNSAPRASFGLASCSGQAGGHERAVKADDKAAAWVCARRTERFLSVCKCVETPPSTSESEA